MLKIRSFKLCLPVSWAHVVLNISGNQIGVKRPYNAISSKKSAGTGNKGGNGSSNQRNKKSKVTMCVLRTSNCTK